MGFSSRRGRPRVKIDGPDTGTPELRRKQTLGLTSEPIDLCLERGLITPDHHWCGLHLRWLYTVRYGAPVVTTRYGSKETLASAEPEDSAWRIEREGEYHDAIAALHAIRRYECTMRLCVFNERPAFLSKDLTAKAWGNPALAEQLAIHHRMLREGLDALVDRWRKSGK